LIHQVQFGQVWEKLRRELASLQVIHNWTRLGLPRPGLYRTAGWILCPLRAALRQGAAGAEGDFEAVYEL
jgi:hypothetical protein